MVVGAALDWLTRLDRLDHLYRWGYRHVWMVVFLIFFTPYACGVITGVLL